MSGVLVAVVGPSGAGKDTVMRCAATQLGECDDVVFVRRLITRPPGEFEDHWTLTENAFATGVARGHFALAWRAHGLGYALPRAVSDLVRLGSIAVCNLSRGAVGEAERRFATVVTVMVTAPPAVIAARLAARGRENAATIEARVRREAALSDFTPDHVIVNDGPSHAGGAALVEIIEALRSRQEQIPIATGVKAG
jgi:ribose 1,5-bisphosphokinase